MGAAALLSGAHDVCTAAAGFAGVTALAIAELSTTEAIAARTSCLLCRGLFSCDPSVFIHNDDAWVQRHCLAGRNQVTCYTSGTNPEFEDPERVTLGRSVYVAAVFRHLWGSISCCRYHGGLLQPKSILKILRMRIIAPVPQKNTETDIRMPLSSDAERHMWAGETPYECTGG